jgi:8-oxo-dGTP diphosphatase
MLAGPAALRGILSRMSVSRQTLCYVFRPGESEAACAVREAAEEGGITVEPGGLTWRAELSFVFPTRPGLDAVVTVFFGREWAGEPRESEEMTPEWFDVATLPLDQMWDDEAYWLPRVMAGETLAGVITYDDACQLVARADLTAASAPG